MDCKILIFKYDSVCVLLYINIGKDHQIIVYLLISVIMENTREVLFYEISCI